MKPTANRVRRLLAARPRFGSKTVEIVSSATTAATCELSSSCSADCCVDMAADDHSTLSSGSSCFEGDGGDPYSDVRDRLESLSHRDQVRYAYESNPHPHPFVPALIAYTCYFAYAVLLVVGQALQLVGDTFHVGRYWRRRDRPPFPSEDPARYAPLITNWEKLYTRRIYHRVQDCFNRPISSAAGVSIDVLERVSSNRQKSLEVLGKIEDLPETVRRDYDGCAHLLTHETSVDAVARRCLNLGSYNYLGFADDWQTTCKESVVGSLDDYPVSCSSNLREYGRTALHRKLERTVAEFLGKEDALVFNMGYNTNASTLPTLCGPGDLILSDALNHTSIVSGARASGAAISTFRHADVGHLEEVLRQAILLGRPRTRRPWRKIWILVEGVYSMEGTYCDLRSVVRIAKQYGAYVYLDEAHSIGAVGPTGRGCAEYTGVSVSDIDVMMGTFTKSFAGMGGYVAGDRDTIAYMRRNCSGSAVHNSLSPVVCQQVLTAFEVIMGKDGTNVGKQKLQALRDNSNYFRMRLEEMGLQVLGPYDSPVIPVMLYHMTKIGGFSRECLKRGIAVVVVGAPAVPILECRARFCMSAGHTRSQLDMALKEIDDIVDLVNIRQKPRQEYEQIFGEKED